MVISTRILRNGEGVSRGVGFARMDNKVSAWCGEGRRFLNQKFHIIFYKATFPNR